MRDGDWCAQAGAAIRAYDRDHVVIGYSLDGGVQWQAEAPQHQPGGFVKGVVGAVTKRHLRPCQLPGGLVDQCDDGFRFRGHADNPACRFSRTRR